MSAQGDQDRSEQNLDEVSASEAAASEDSLPGEAGEGSASAATAGDPEPLTHTQAIEIVDEAIASGTLANRLRSRLLRHSQDVQEPEEDDEPRSDFDAIIAQPDDFDDDSDDLDDSDDFDAVNGAADVPSDEEEDAVAEVEDPAVEEDAGIEVEGPAEEEDAGIQTEEEPLEGASESAEPTFDELSTPEEQSDDVSDTQTPDESPVQDGDSCRELDEETRATVAREAMIPGTLAAWMVRMKKLIVPGATGENADGELPAEGAESASATQPDSEQGDAVQLDELGQSYEDEADASELDSLYEDAADEGELDPLYEDAADEGEVFADDTTVLPPVPAPSSTPAASSAPAADDVSSDPSATSRLSSAGQRARLTFTRQGVQVLRLEQGTKAISRSLRSARSTIDTFNAGERVDPTKPAIITLAVGVLVATVIAATTLFGGAPDLSFRRQAPVAAPTPVETETAQPTETPEAPSSVAPQIASVEVISVDNDGGDHPEWVEYMLDGDTSTHWQSRYFGVSELPEGNTVRLVIKLKEAAPVSEVVLTGPVEGGQVDLRVNDGSDPFGTKVLTSSKMSETTSLKPSEATEGTTVTLNFYALPVDDEGSLRVKVSTLTVK